MPCTDSTSSDDSSYQPAAPHSSAAVSSQVLAPGCRTVLNWPFENGLSSAGLPPGWPAAHSAYWLASDFRVGGMYASMTATVTPLPVSPDWATLYAPRTWAGV